MRRAKAAGFLLGAAALGYVGLVRGALTIDLGIGRRTRELGPLRRRIEATPETVFDVIAGPYLGRTPHAMADKLEVLERGSDMVLAAHFTPIAAGMRATTVETVRFERPRRITFRLVRGPVPEVLETFALEPVNGATEFEYRGQLSTDLWALGSWWGDKVARRWEAAVAASLESISAEAERRSAAARR
jgi:hypothetical protein